jgi:hypothetical protein
VALVAPWAGKKPSSWAKGLGAAVGLSGAIKVGATAVAHAAGQRQDGNREDRSFRDRNDNEQVADNWATDRGHFPHQ